MELKLEMKGCGREGKGEDKRKKHKLSYKDKGNSKGKANLRRKHETTVNI